LACGGESLAAARPRRSILVRFRWRGCGPEAAREGGWVSETPGAADVRAAHAATIKNMGEAALDHFAALAHGLLADARFQSAAVAIHRRARLGVAMPTQITLGGFRFGDAGLPGPAVERLETIARVISLSATRSLGSSHVGVRPTAARFFCASSSVGPMWGRASPCRQPPPNGSAPPPPRRCNRMLRLEGQMARAVLHPGDLRIGIGRARPIPVRKLLALPLAIQSDLKWPRILGPVA
jgi:hypothetical protein